MGARNEFIVLTRSSMWEF